MTIYLEGEVKVRAREFASSAGSEGLMIGRSLHPLISAAQVRGPFDHIGAHVEFYEGLGGQEVVTSGTSAREWLVDELIRVCEPGAHRAVLLEDALGRASDPEPDSYEGCVLLVDDTVYYVVTPAVASRSSIELALNAAEHAYPPVIGAVVDARFDEVFPLGRNRVHPFQLRQVIETVSHVFVGAFDGESYLLFER